MDFWLSFIAVVSTFVFMATIDESSKRAIHTVVAIITALLAVSGATRSRYCPIVFDLNMTDGSQRSGVGIPLAPVPFVE